MWSSSIVMARSGRGLDRLGPLIPEITAETGMGHKTALRVAGAIGAAALAQAGAGRAAALMDWPDLLGRPMPAPTRHIAYGPGPMQFGELWLPAGKGPFPVVLMVHGGCWLSSVAKLSIMNWAAEDLRQRGVAVWNIEYRGVDR